MGWDGQRDLARLQGETAIARLVAWHTHRSIRNAHYAHILFALSAFMTDTKEQRSPAWTSVSIKCGWTEARLCNTCLYTTMIITTLHSTHPNRRSCLVAFHRVGACAAKSAQTLATLAHLKNFESLSRLALAVGNGEVCEQRWMSNNRSGGVSVLVGKPLADCQLGAR